jgi:hypothetical protein
MSEQKQETLVGNAAKMREALLKAIVLLRVCDWPDDTPMQAVAEVIEEIEKASSAPPRNCDVGTAEEQAERFKGYCATHKDPEADCLDCPIFGVTGGHCELAWAQKSYNEIAVAACGRNEFATRKGKKCDNV